MKINKNIFVLGVMRGGTLNFFVTNSKGHSQQKVGSQEVACIKEVLRYTSVVFWTNFYRLCPGNSMSNTWDLLYLINLTALETSAL